MRTRGTVQLATRGSALARRQTAQVRTALEDRRYDVEVVEIETTGDQLDDELIHRLGKTGAFVRALDQAVLDDDADAAVHSMKDMPTEQPEALVTAGIPERAAPGDALVTPVDATLEDLPEGAVVGTSSLRRTAQLLAVRPDLDITPLRGNVDTRVEKLLAPHRQREHERRLEAEADEEDAGDRFDRSPQEWFERLAEIERRALEREVDAELDAIVLARAGLDRSGLAEAVPVHDLPLETFVPAAGQGAIAVTAIDNTEAAEAIHEAVDHPRTRVETTVERVVLAELGAGCIAPMGVNAVIRGEVVHVRAQVLDRAGDEQVADSRDLPVRTYVDAAREFAADLIDRGAAELVEAARSEADRPAAREEDGRQ
jgi:hydroxymethylbilane synthase